MATTPFAQSLSDARLMADAVRVHIDELKAVGMEENTADSLDAIVKVMSALDTAQEKLKSELKKTTAELNAKSVELNAIMTDCKRRVKLAIKKDKGIEVNTSCYRYHLKDLTPSHDILNLYKDLGGEILTVGSDSHEESHLGFKIKDTYAELSRLGFKYFYTFDKMKPVGHNLVA